MSFAAVQRRREAVEHARKALDAEMGSQAPPPFAGGWPEPQPIITAGSAEPYPLEAIPDPIRATVAEVQGFTQAPVPLVAASALAALSVAGQALVDVRRAAGLEGPVGLFLLTVADSGERKTSGDNFFTRPIQAWEREQAEQMKPAVADWCAGHAGWLAKRDGLLAAIKNAQKGGKATSGFESDLRDLETLEPVAPRVPRLVRVDSTPEALAHALAHEWPSAAVLSSEAGSVLGGHAMSRESQMRSLALLNTVWDGGSLHVSRRTSDSYTLRGVRLTMGLQAQPAAIRAFSEQSDGLARGMGFLARFLVAWPESTQGTRVYRDPPTTWPALSTYTRRLIELLDVDLQLDDDGALDPAVLALSPEAKALWIRFHDDVERELAAHGELSEVRDVAAKGADNCARLAALFHLIECGVTGTISGESIERAGRIVTWHLLEVRRFFRGLAVPPELARAARLDAWLLAQGVASITTREVQNRGPVRERGALDAAIDELAEAGRVRRETLGRQRLLTLNPHLIGGNHGPA